MKREKAIQFGFSLIEVVVAIAMVGLIASISFAVVTQISSSAKAEKLSSDTDTLNRAISAYLASGGSLAGAKTPADVLTRLKSGASDEQRKRMPGFSSSLIDPRISLVMQDASEAASGDPRVQWIAASQRFVVATSGVAGVKEFTLDDTLAETPGAVETRDSSVLYAKESTWVWDYQNRSNPAANGGPTVVAVVADVSTPPTPATVPPAGPPVVPPVIPPAGNLAPPIFSLPGGTYGIDLYTLSLSISDPNPPGSSKIIYAVDFGSWQDYSGTISASPGSTVSAQSVALVPGWSDSGKVDQSYAANPATLTPPAINPNRDTFGLFYQFNINVSLSDTNKPGTSTTRYRVNGGAWQDYNNPFLLNRNDYPSGATIEAQAVSSGSPYYLASSVSSRTLSNESLNLTGDTSGEFHDPTGPSGMLTNLPPGNTSSYFEWGDGNGAGRSESWMDFSGGSFADVAEGERFNIGSLTYYNGTIAAGSGAETIDLDIGLELDINGNTFNPYFDFAFELVNSPNSSDPWASADYVRLMDPRASRTLVINDNEFEFRLEFGETSADGFSLFDEFYVLEDKDASVNIYGTFVSLGPVSTSGDPVEGGTKIDITTGTAADPVYQKEGYIDPEQLSGDLLQIARDARDTAKAGRDDAEDGAALALKGAQDVAKKISEGKYLEADKLAADAAAGAADAEVAAKRAEDALAIATAAVTRAKQLYDIDEEVADDYADISKAYNETQAFANEARAAADAAAADAATATGIWSDFMTNGPTSDPLGYAAYLAGVAKAERDAAKSARDDAQGAASTAASRTQDTSNKISEGKYDEARDKEAEAADAAALAEQWAQAAETAAVSANAAAVQANTIASTNPGAAADAQKAADYAVEADAFAVEARTAANLAAAEAANAAAMIAALP